MSSGLLGPPPAASGAAKGKVLLASPPSPALPAPRLLRGDLTGRNAIRHRPYWALSKIIRPLGRRVREARVDAVQVRLARRGRREAARDVPAPRPRHERAHGARIPYLSLGEADELAPRAPMGGVPAHLRDARGELTRCVRPMPCSGVLGGASVSLLLTCRDHGRGRHAQHAEVGRGLSGHGDHGPFFPSIPCHFAGAV